MGPKWVPSGADRTLVGPMYFAIWDTHTEYIRLQIHKYTPHHRKLQHRLLLWQPTEQPVMTKSASWLPLGFSDIPPHGWAVGTFAINLIKNYGDIIGSYSWNLSQGYPCGDFKCLWMNKRHPNGPLSWPHSRAIPDSKVHGANMGPTWVLSAPGGPNVGSRNLAIRDVYHEYFEYFVICLSWLCNNETQ